MVNSSYYNVQTDRKAVTRNLCYVQSRSWVYFFARNGMRVVFLSFSSTCFSGKDIRANFYVGNLISYFSLSTISSPLAIHIQHSKHVLREIVQYTRGGLSQGLKLPKLQ